MTTEPLPPGHKAGFVNIIGKPNVGKSTLMNRLVGEKLSIITSKAQTTRHRVMGIINGDAFQIVYSDTPGIISPHYELQRSMMNYVKLSLEDADIVLFMVEAGEKFDKDQHLPLLKETEGKVLLLINKIDKLATDSDVDEAVSYWKEAYDFDGVIPVSALLGTHLDRVFDEVVRLLPEHPPYYPKDQLTDKAERFFAAEIIREKIFLFYKQEVPYSTEVAVTEFKEDETIIRMRAEIFVERQSQKGIIIGKGGSALKKVGVEARKDLEAFFEKQVHLETYVKVEAGWRERKSKLGKLGFH